MHTIQTAFGGDTAEQIKARFAALKRQHPHLGDRGIYCLIARELKKRGTALRLGFDEGEVA
jgi:hypothetical protein